MTDWLFDCVDFGVDDRIIQLPTVATDGVSFVKTTETKIDTINFSRTSRHRLRLQRVSSSVIGASFEWLFDHL